MKILIIEHADHESTGIISDWIEENNFSSKTVKPFKGDSLPTNEEFDFLVIMGGPQSAIETDKHPYLINEIDFIKRSIKYRKHVLGICLGAQLISEALGNKTSNSEFKEIGFYPVQFTDSAVNSILLKGFPKELNILHWHNDMPGINESMTSIGSSKGCSKQGFIYKDKVVGLQFHLEIRRKDVDAMIEYDKEIIQKGGEFIMSPDEIRNHDFNEINNYMKLLLDNLVK